MPLSYESDAARRLMIVWGKKGLSYQDVIQHQETLKNDPRVTAGMTTLVDLRELTAFEMAGRDVFNLAQTRDEYPFFSSHGKTAILVGDKITFAMARMYMLSRRKHVEPMAVFYDHDEALRWLGFESPLA